MEKAGKRWQKSQRGNYNDDIKEIFDDECDPLALHDLYEDDLVLISETKQGLQRSLDKVAEFANSKQLTISVDKSKSMIFNTSGKLIKETFKLYRETV